MVGFIVLACFSAIWAMAGLFQLHAAPVWYGLPVVIGAALLWGALAARGGMPATTTQDKARIDRVVSIWSAVEGVAIFIAVNIEGNTGHAAWTVPTICLIVGLHFIPLARGLPMPLYYRTAVAMVALALAGFLAPARVTPGLVSLGAAAILWITILWALQRAFARMKGQQGAG